MSATRTLSAALAAGAAALVLVAGCISPAVAEDAAADGLNTVMTPELQAKLQDKITQIQNENAIPGMSMAVITKDPGGTDPVTTTFSVGTPTLGSSTPVDTSTQFEIGSETKIFTTDLLTYLVAAGVVKLDDPVQMYAPEGITVPVWTADDGTVTPITLRDLATHQAGLPDSPANYWQPCHGTSGCDPQPDYTQKMLWHALADHDLLWQPGGYWLYSNFGFALLGVILTNLIQPTSWEDPPAYLSSLQSVFADDLGMPATLLGTGPLIATPYDENGVETVYWDDVNAMAGEGGLVSDTTDMARWTAAHLGYVPADAPLGVRTLADTLEPQTTITTLCTHEFEKDCSSVTDFRMGLGWQLYPATQQGMDTDWAFKNGGTAGFSTDTALAPHLGVGVTLMWNKERADHDGIDPGPNLLSMVLHFTAEDHHGGDKPRLPATGPDTAATVMTAVGGAALLAAGSVLVRGRGRGRRQTGDRVR